MANRQGSKSSLPSSCVSSLVGWAFSPESAETHGLTLKTQDMHVVKKNSDVTFKAVSSTN